MRENELREKLIWHGSRKVYADTNEGLLEVVNVERQGASITILRLAEKGDKNPHRIPKPDPRDIDK